MASTILDPIVKILRQAFAEYGIKIRQTSGFRTTEQQSSLYGQAESNKYPVAPPGTSQHEFGLAVDMVTDPPEYQELLGMVWAEIGLSWSQSDPVHFAVFSRDQWTSLLLQMQYGNIEAPQRASMQSLQAYPTQYREQYSAASPFDLLGTPYEPSSQQYQGGQYAGQWASYADRSTYPISSYEVTRQYQTPQQQQPSPGFSIPTMPGEDFYPSLVPAQSQPSEASSPAPVPSIANPPVLTSAQRRLLRRGGTELEVLLG